MEIPFERLESALAEARRELIAHRAEEGYWTGELSSSALSTATAIIALAVLQRETSGRFDFTRQIAVGLGWLREHVNVDGGWGDTTDSISNISTTTLCWAALGCSVSENDIENEVVERAQVWLQQATSPFALRGHTHEVGTKSFNSALAAAITSSYGHDRTFSVPILTACALAGRFGSGRDAWRYVKPLPFELAVLPKSFFSALKMPVVSYALPALIAIGQARHYHAPARNPLTRMLRSLVRRPALRVLGTVQPSNGGFLEAIPLTSFVVMSLAGTVRADNSVLRRGLDFILNSQREDGSWAIDTNLSTWITTLAVRSLGREYFAQDEVSPKSWLLNQQHRITHPYTNAAPGGWAWTNLPGGVPDADDTAGALLALRTIQCGELDQPTRQAVSAGIRWLLGIQNVDGGIPTFCRGWGAMPFDRSSPDLTAHAIRAWMAWANYFPDLRVELESALRQAINYLLESQRPDGAWVPLWFGNQLAPNQDNLVYGTTRVLLALTHFDRSAHCAEAHRKAVAWVLKTQRPGGFWGSTAQGGTVEETAWAVEALAAVLPSCPIAQKQAVRMAVISGTEWLIYQMETGQWTIPAPLGLYFAKLWYSERLYPIVFTVAALRRAQHAISAKAKLDGCPRKI